MAQNNKLEKLVITHKFKDNGFEYIEIKNDLAHAKIALQGAHIFEYAREGEESVLWLSEIAYFEKGESIRGGIPVCWPWFGMPKDDTLPQHGFARTAKWDLINTKESGVGITELTLRLKATPQTLKLWPHRFELELHVVVSDKLSMELKTTNIDDKAFTITQALHTYFNVSHISHVKIQGLDKKPYLDALTWHKEIQNGDITFHGEVDRVYQEVSDEILLIDKNKTVAIKNEGSSSVVVWNPWIEKCKRMSAMRDEDYKSMVCIESSNAFDDFKEIMPGESHTLRATIISL